MAVQTLFPKKAIIEVQDASKVNYFAADGRKSFICRVFMKAEKILCEYAEFYKIYFQILFLTHLFNTILFKKVL